jgi:hypothetical protein
VTDQATDEERLSRSLFLNKDPRHKWQEIRSEEINYLFGAVTEILEPRLGRRTALTFPLLPPPQKKPIAAIGLDGAKNRTCLGIDLMDLTVVRVSVGQNLIPSLSLNLGFVLLFQPRDSHYFNP